MGTDNKTVSLITINLNGKHLLAELLDSVRGLDYPAEKLEIIVVDNGSTDGSVEFLKKNHPEVIIIKNGRNLGFAYPCNQGARAATGEYLAFVNNDMKLDRFWVREMLKYMDREKDVICVGSKIFNTDGTKIDFIGGHIDFIGKGYQKNFRKDATLYNETGPKEILFACGGAMLIDRRIFLEVGGFDEDYFAFYEDVDLGWRLWVLGYKVVFAPGAAAYHKHHQTAKLISKPMSKTLYERNSLCTIYKNYGVENLTKAFTVVHLMSSVRLVDSLRLDLSKYVINDPLFVKRSVGRKRSAINKSYWKLAGFFLDTLASLLLDFRLRSRKCAPARREHFSPAVAATHFGFNLERMTEKRDFIQRNRKRSDDEVLELFKDSFGLETVEANYNRLVMFAKKSLD